MRPVSAAVRLACYFLAILLAHSEEVTNQHPAAVSAPAALSWGTGTRVLLVGGGTSHDFARWFNQADSATLAALPGFSVQYTEDTKITSQELPRIDVLVMSTNQKDFDTPDFRHALTNFVAGGKGLVLLHPAVWYNGYWADYNRTLVGGGARGHDELKPFTVEVLTHHPVTSGLPKQFQMTDELYHFEPDSHGPPIQILAQATSALDGRSYPSIWLVQHPHARIVCIALGHDGQAHGSAEFKTLLQNAVHWSAARP